MKKEIFMSKIASTKPFRLPNS